MTNQEASTAPVSRETTYGMMLDIVAGGAMDDQLANFAITLTEDSQFQRIVQEFQAWSGLSLRFTDCFDGGEQNDHEFAFFISRLVLAGILQGALFGAASTLQWGDQGTGQRAPFFGSWR